MSITSLMDLLQVSEKKPLSTRLRASREQIGHMFDAGELNSLPADTRLYLRGLQMFLLDTEWDALLLELTQAKKHKEI
jgi:hypothetical protein